MNKEEIKRALLQLTKEERCSLIKEIDELENVHNKVINEKREKLDNKQGQCPHCGSCKYNKYGFDKGSKRYKCKACMRTFTEYSGTWISKIHKKNLLGNYVSLMEQEKSLDAIKLELQINKKTALDWRHKILTGLDSYGNSAFQGITESDDTFFLHSEKGSKKLKRESRKRGGSAKKRGISDEQVAVIVSTDRTTEYGMNVASLGRIKKKDIEKAIGERVSEKTILCSDSHKSYIGFAKDKKIEHHTIKTCINQFVKNKIYHIQNVNSIDSRLKKWINGKFNGVSTKYLQKYLNWFKAKEKLKVSLNFVEQFTNSSLLNTSAWKNYKATEQIYNETFNLS